MMNGKPLIHNLERKKRNHRTGLQPENAKIYFDSQDVLKQEDFTNKKGRKIGTSAAAIGTLKHSSVSLVSSCLRHSKSKN